MRRDCALGHVHAVAITTLVLFFIVCRSSNSCTRAIGSTRATGQAASSATANKIEPWVIEHTANDKQAEMMVVLVDQADLRPAADLPTKNEKSHYVHGRRGLFIRTMLVI